MAGRIRTVKPDWLEDELLSESSSEARVLSIALILLADDYGRGRGSEKYLGAQVFPGHPIKVIRDALSRLVEIRYCRIYVVDGQSYFAIRNWAKHQKVDKPGKGKVPEPPENIREGLDSSPECLEKDGDDLAPRARPLPSQSIPNIPVPDPERGAGENHAEEPPEPEDRETVCPMDLVERADRGGLIDQCAKAYAVTPAVIRHHVAETLAYWTVGPGAGRRRRNWLKTVRSRLLELHKAGRLSVPVEAQREADAAEARRRREAAEAAHAKRQASEVRELAAKVGARAVPPEELKAAVAKLAEGA